MPIAGWELFLFPLEELHCGFGVQQGNIIPALPYIPGRVVRGGLAGWALRNAKLQPSQGLFKGIFHPRHHLVSSYKQKISFPMCTYRGYIPAPFSLFALKGAGLHPHSHLVMAHEEVYPDDLELRKETPAAPLDFLRRSQWPFQVDMSLKPFKGLIGDYHKLVPPLSPLIDLRAHHQEDQGRVGENGLYAEEVLPATTILTPFDCFYQGTLFFEDCQEIKAIFTPLLAPVYLDEDDPDPLQKMLQDPHPRHLVFLGRRRLPVVAIAREQAVEDEEFLSAPAGTGEMQEFTLTFISDYQGENPFPLTASTLEQNFGIGNLEKKRVFCRAGLAHGYDVEENKALSPLPTLAAGSCGFFSGVFSEECARKLKIASVLGAGQNTLDGFGRFLINWPIHQLRRTEV
jgi:hypothetical protein